VVDNPSWILPYAQSLADELDRGGDRAVLCRRHADIGTGGAAFYLGCIHLVPRAVLDRNYRNLVVHESGLPEGRGFSPLTWQILEGRDTVPICLLEAREEPDAGPVVYRELMHFHGHELLDELRAVQGRVTVALCRRYLDGPSPPRGEPQRGEPSHYRRRGPEDSRLDTARAIADQFELLRVADNERYPAFFEHRGYRYVLRIEKAGKSTASGAEPEGAAESGEPGKNPHL